MNDGPLSPATAVALVIGTVATFWLCVKALVYALTALLSAVHML